MKRMVMALGEPRDGVAIIGDENCYKNPLPMPMPTKVDAHHAEAVAIYTK